MNIDTLILSGGGPSGIAYNGIYKALLEKNIIDQKLTGIQELITTSVGIIFCFGLLIQLNCDVFHSIIMRYDLNSLLNVDNITIDSLLLDFGIFETDGVEKIIRSLVQRVLHKDDINLQELYDLTNVKLTVKVFNVTKKQTQYISYETHPELSIITLSKMTTAIPIFFKPVVYNEEYYVDGGMRGNIPLEACTSENYLGILIDGGSSTLSEDSIKKFPLLEFLISLMKNNDNRFHEIKSGKFHPRIIHINANLGLNFNISNEVKEQIIQNAYAETLAHFEKIECSKKECSKKECSKKECSKKECSKKE